VERDSRFDGALPKVWAVMRPFRVVREQRGPRWRRRQAVIGAALDESARKESARLREFGAQGRGPATDAMADPAGKRIIAAWGGSRLAAD